MSSFAKLDDNNMVTEVIKGDPAMTDQEALDFITDTYGGSWVQTSFNATIRYNYAGIGYIYDSSALPDGAFYTPQPYASWALDSNYQWQAPVPYPTDGQIYNWNEATLSWDVVDETAPK